MTLKLVKNTPNSAIPPRKLGKHGMDLWRSVTGEYLIDDCGGIELLTGACQSLDRAESCRAQIDRDGEMLKTKTGLKEHPLLKAELACRAFIARSIQRLGLEFEAVRASPGRPGIWDRRGG